MKNLIFYSVAISCQSDYPRTPEDILVYHSSASALATHPRAHVILGRALLHSWFKWRIKTFARKQDSAFFSVLVRVRASGSHYRHCENK